MDSCVMCMASILWTETNGGEPIMVDLEPDAERGSVVLRSPAHPSDPPIAVLVSKAWPHQAGEQVFANHLDTCAEANPRTWSVAR